MKPFTDIEKVRIKDKVKAAGLTKGKCYGICPYCTGTMIVGHKKRMPTRDHIKPKSKHPKGTANKIIIVCSECNFMKADMTLSEFLLDLEKKNRQLELAIALNKERIDNISYLLQIGIEE